MKIQSLLAGITFLGIFFSCSTPKKNEGDLAAIELEIVETEMAFSNYSKTNGFAKALAKFASDDVIKLNSGQYPSIGKAKLQHDAHIDSIGSSQGTLTWRPLKVDVSESGDMASVFGDWSYAFKPQGISSDSTLHGNYITIWKRQKDGSWKFILDGGNPTPGPTSDDILMKLK